MNLQTIKNGAASIVSTTAKLAATTVAVMAAAEVAVGFVGAAGLAASVSAIGAAVGEFAAAAAGVTALNAEFATAAAALGAASASDTAAMMLAAKSTVSAVRTGLQTGAKVYGLAKLVAPYIGFSQPAVNTVKPTNVEETVGKGLVLTA